MAEMTDEQREQEEKKKRRVVDKRFLNRDGEPVESAPPEPEPEPQPQPEPEAKAAEPQPEPEAKAAEPEPASQGSGEPAGDEPPARVEDILRYFVGVIASQAWLNLGFIPDPRTNEVKVDRPEAKLAIDTVKALFELLREKLDAQETQELQRMVSDLQINFVNKSK